ncbi:hypothetical protein ACN9JF_03705 [Pseudoalteromonas lipolytica]|uniref:hypothetical protein n=1 Tax=Pseudoalteromonas lipolytica TaxID=570156 RepID=UPI001427DC68|nr:hypothetical protein [Pseudoalteromonas lipolytica]
MSSLLFCYQTVILVQANTTVTDTTSIEPLKIIRLYFNNKTNMTSWLSYAKIGTGVSLTA